MGGFVRVLRAEVMKVRWGSMLAILLVAPLLVALMEGIPEPSGDFTMYYMNSVMVYGWLLYPILAGIFAALVCRTEHLAGGWKQMLSLPVRRTHVYLAKYAIVAALLAVSQILLLATMVGLLWAGGMDIEPYWGVVGRGLLSGWIAVLPLAALQMWVSTRWGAFGGPLALNVAFTIPALFAVQSAEYGPWYPWGQPFLGMMAPIVEKGQSEMLAFSTETLLIVIVGGFVAWTLGGLAQFVRADIHA